MIIICKYDNLVGATCGKKYENISVKIDFSYDDTHYCIMDDNGEYNWWSKEYFDTLSDIRDDKLNKLLGEN